MPKEIAIIAAATIIALGFVGGCYLIAGALNDLRGLLSNIRVLVNHVHEANERGGAK